MNTKNTALVFICAAALLAASSTSARDDRLRFPIAEAMSAPDAAAQLNQGIQFFFGDAPHPGVERSFGVFTTNKKTNGVGKSDKVACDWAFLSAMVSLQERAIREGGNAVINIHSYYKKVTVNSATEYECGAGGMMVGVAFQGEVVKLKG